jgi:hypothetical protein
MREMIMHFHLKEEVKYMFLGKHMLSSEIWWENGTVF